MLLGNIRPGRFLLKVLENLLNDLAAQDDIKHKALEKIKVKKHGPYPIDWAKNVQASANLSFRYKTVGGSAGYSTDRTSNAELELIRLEIAESNLKKLLNSHAIGARSAMNKEGCDARIVSKVWVVVDAQLGSQIKNCFKGDIAASKDALKLKLAGNGCSKTTTSVTLPRDVTFAYSMHKVKKWKKKKKVRYIDDMEDDYKGLN